MHAALCSDSEYFFGLQELADQEAKAQFDKQTMSADLELMRNTVSIFQQQKEEAG